MLVFVGSAGVVLTVCVFELAGVVFVGVVFVATGSVGALADLKSMVLAAIGVLRVSSFSI